MRVVGIDNGSFDRPEPVFSEMVDPELVDEVDEQELPLVLVTWHDAWFDFDQPTSDDSRADYLVRTVGFLVSDGPRFLSVPSDKFVKCHIVHAASNRRGDAVKN